MTRCLRTGLHIQPGTECTCKRCSVEPTPAPWFGYTEIRVGNDGGYLVPAELAPALAAWLDEHDPKPIIVSSQ
jgi:hypothetical protein